MPWLTVAALTNIPESQMEVRETASKLTEEGVKYSRTLDAGTLIIANSGATLGVAKLLGIKCCANDGIAALLNLDKAVSPLYLVYSFNTQTENLRNRVATGNGQPNLNTGLVGSLAFAFPPTLAEQEAIAGALSDADALIDSLEQLIAKKRLLKQGAMQDLLTGKKRLPGFEGEWETVTLAELGEISGSGVDKKIRENEEPVRLLNYMDVYRRDFVYRRDLWHEVTAPSHKARRCGIAEGDVFFTPSSEVRDDIGHSAVAMEDMPGCCYSYHVVRLRLHKPWDLNFRAYAFKTKAFMDQASMLCDGSGTRYVISQAKFRSMEVTVPRDIAEQTAIAAILSDMDAGIAALEAKLAKARQVKQGMMQELLTGKTRLPGTLSPSSARE
jgi:type I restriction enzyme S subunit